MKRDEKETKTGKETILEIANRVNERIAEGKEKDKRYNSFAG